MAVQGLPLQLKSRGLSFDALFQIDLYDTFYYQSHISECTVKCSLTSLFHTEHLILLLPHFYILLECKL